MNPLTLLYDKYESDIAFNHLRQEDVNFVPGVGPKNAKVMLVGWAPSVDENAKKVPFVGPAGRELDKILKDIGLERDEIFLTNVVKYWTRTTDRKSRAPNQDEVQHSKPYILREIEIVDPIFVGLCGRISIQTIFPNVPSVRSQHGKLLADRFIPLYHPAVTLYKEEKRQEVRMGYRVIRSLLDALGE